MVLYFASNAKKHIFDKFDLTYFINIYKYTERKVN